MMASTPTIIHGVKVARYWDFRAKPAMTATELELEGTLVGAVDGSDEGLKVGKIVVGAAVGVTDGIDVGAVDGCKEG
jgi:hypothetical protein